MNRLERIREIRASERKFYQKITDLYATAIDYDEKFCNDEKILCDRSNKMHYAVHGHTAGGADRGKSGSHEKSTWD